MADVRAVTAPPLEQHARAASVRGIICVLLAAIDGATVVVIIGTGPVKGVTGWPMAVWAVVAGMGALLMLCLAALNFSRRAAGGGAALLVVLTMVLLLGAEIVLLVRVTSSIVTGPVAIMIGLQTAPAVLLALWTRHGVAQRAAAR